MKEIKATDTNVLANHLIDFLRNIGEEKDLWKIVADMRKDRSPEREIVMHLLCSAYDKIAYGH